MTENEKLTTKNVMKRIKEKELSSFGDRDLIVSDDNREAAERDARRLEIRKKYQRMIIKGTLPQKKGEERFIANPVAQARLNVMVALIKAGYRYDTIFCIFFNEHLGCSYLVRGKTEDEFKKDLLEAKELVRRETFEGSWQKRAIGQIKSQDLKREDEVKDISNFILEDLITRDNPVGKGFYNEDRKIPYFFDNEEKQLIDVESDEFYFYVRDRFDIPKKDYEPEVKDTIRTYINRHEARIEAHTLAYFDKNTDKLYISDHDNGIYLLDGKKIRHVDNGTDGVYFEFNSDFTPFSVDVENLKTVNYFEREIPEGKAILKNGTKIRLPRRKGLGLNYSKFNKENSLLYRYLVDVTSFAETEKNLTVTDQRFLLLTYFYSLFFESIMVEKPIICFVGLKDSGKSTIGALMGKILFGDKFQCRYFPEDVRDFKTIIAENYFMVFDNVDQYVNPELMNALCVAATGGTIERRKLYTDRDIIKLRPHIFLGITTREAKFKRDDLISRLILFNTEKITERIQKEKFYRDIEENRDKIMAEVLVNLNSIIELLKKQKGYSPKCTFRVADWETFGRKICVGLPWGLYFKLIMDVMNVEKDKFALEDDPLYALLEDIVIANGEAIEDKSASELYIGLEKHAETLKMKDFTKRYKSPRSMAMRIKNVQDELERVFVVEIRGVRANITLYSFSPRAVESIEPKKEDVKEKVEEIREKNTPSSQKEPRPEGKKKKLTPEEMAAAVERIRAKHRIPGEEK